jgi:hypothetical protein
MEVVSIQTVFQIPTQRVISEVEIRGMRWSRPFVATMPRESVCDNMIANAR